MLRIINWYLVAQDGGWELVEVPRMPKSDNPNERRLGLEKGRATEK